ncbi:hypothetical protein PR048_019890 [Dryococelus australis]|uniref:Uncharacterized protein n=1 Tax=Dryococelus australis TaxID=614101 RepID=A0ABQ9H4R9_9NEOP|nr:hypothetical protein PR048_019890 [Dryococelus australis]
MDRRRNTRTGGGGDPRKNPPTSDIVGHNSNSRKSGATADPRGDIPATKSGGEAVRRLEREDLRERHGTANQAPPRIEGVGKILAGGGRSPLPRVKRDMARPNTLGVASPSAIPRVLRDEPMITRALSSGRSWRPAHLEYSATTPVLLVVARSAEAVQDGGGCGRTSGVLCSSSNPRHTSSLTLLPAPPPRHYFRSYGLLFRWKERNASRDLTRTPPAIESESGFSACRLFRCDSRVQRGYKPTRIQVPETSLKAKSAVTDLICPVQRYDGNTARLARKSDEALGVRVSVARITPSLLDFGSGVPSLRGALKDFQNFARMTKSDFEELLHLVVPKITKGNTNYRLAIPPSIRLAVGLRFIATGDSYTSLMYLFKISKQSVSVIVPEVCEALIEALHKYCKVSPNTSSLLSGVWASSFVVDSPQNDPDCTAADQLTLESSMRWDFPPSVPASQ